MKDAQIIHYSDFAWALRRLKSKGSQQFFEQIIQANKKEIFKFPHYCPFKEPVIPKTFSHDDIIMFRLLNQMDKTPYTIKYNSYNQTTPNQNREPGGHMT